MRLTSALRSSPLARRSPPFHLPIALRRPYSTGFDDVPPPPLLQKLKGDLKAAMRAKDAPRLQVLRAVLSANLNASKTSSPVKTDVQLVALMRKLQQNGQDSISDAKSAGREDLIEKEQQQIAILDEYVAGSGVQTLGEAELKTLVQDAVEAAKGAGVVGKAMVGDVMKRLTGALQGKDVDKKALVQMVNDLVKQ